MNLLNKLETKDGTAQMIAECLKVVEESAGIIIFGAGVGGGILYNLLKTSGLSEKILCFSDNNEMKFGKTYCEDRLFIESPNTLHGKFGGKSSILIASSAYDVIKKQLISYGFSEIKIFLFNFAFMDLEYTDRDFIFDNISNFERAYARMADEKSKRILLIFLIIGSQKTPNI